MHASYPLPRLLLLLLLPRFPELPMTISLSDPLIILAAKLRDRGYSIVMAADDNVIRWAMNFAFTNFRRLEYTIETVEAINEYETWRLGNDGDMVVAPERMSQAACYFRRQWADIFSLVRGMCADPGTRPSAIVADYFNQPDAQKVMDRFNTPVIVVTPEVPYCIFPAPVNRLPLELRVSLSLHAEHPSHFPDSPGHLSRIVPGQALAREARRREAARTPFSVPHSIGPWPIVLVNTCRGLLRRRPVPLNVHVGPLAPVWAVEVPVKTDMVSFLNSSSNLICIFCGTTFDTSLITERIIDAVTRLIQDRSIGGAFIGRTVKGSSILMKKQRDLPGTDFYLVEDLSFAHYLMQHDHVRLLLTDGDPINTLPAVLNAKPVLAIPFYTNQKCNISNLCRLGIATCLDSGEITTDIVYKAIKKELYQFRYVGSRWRSVKRAGLLCLSHKDWPVTQIEAAIGKAELAAQHAAQGSTQGDAQSPGPATTPRYQMVVLVGAGVIMALAAAWGWAPTMGLSSHIMSFARYFEYNL